MGGFSKNKMLWDRVASEGQYEGWKLRGNGLLLCQVKFFPLEFLGVLHTCRIPRKNKNTIYQLQISALFPEIFKLKKKNSVKYTNEMSDDVIHSTQYRIKYKNRAISANLQCRPFKLGRLIVLHETQILFPRQPSHGRIYGMP